MTRKHSTRLSQAHDEDPADDGQHTAARDYPELGTILADRPDPGSQITVIGMRRTAAQGDHIYHGFSVALPAHVHDVVHNPDLPEHVRGFHLARHLLTNHPGSPGYPHSGDLLGQDWHRDSYWAARNAEAASGNGRTPYVLMAREPHHEHVLSDEDRKGHPVLLHVGAPVQFTGLYWHHPEHQDPDSPHAGEEGELHFPEPITSIASLQRTAAAYGTEDDARNQEYNGGAGDLGMYWAEPANQDWTEQNLGPQQEAPPPPWDPDMSPVMGRLAQMEEMQGFFGARHHATTINGTQVDDAGDAPEHGTVPRAENPDAYDDASQEGSGDDKWNEAVPWGDKKAENGATVGMYPEGMSAGGGPGLEIGAFTAELREREGRPDFEHAPDLEWSSDFDHEPDPGDRATPVTPDYDSGDPAGSARYHSHEGPIDPVFGSRDPGFTRTGSGDHEWMLDHMRSEHDFPSPEWRSPEQLNELHAHEHLGSQHLFAVPHDHGPAFDYTPDWEGGGDASGNPGFTGSRHTAWVPWTGAERGRLHRWQESPESSTWGDFVNSADFPMLAPGESVHHPEPSEQVPEPMQREAASDRQWEMHLRKDHGWSDANIANVLRRNDRLISMHDALHSGGLANHRHPGGAEQVRDEAREHSLRNMFGRDIAENGPRMGTPEGYPLAAPERGGASGEDPMLGIIRSKEAAPPVHPDYWEQKDPAVFRRMMSALNVHVRIDGRELPAHEHDDEDNSLDGGKDKTPDSGPDKNGPETASAQADDADSLDTPADIPAVARPSGKSSNPAADSRGLPPGDPMNDPANWPQAGADVSERQRAYTQGKDDGKTSRGAPAPQSFSPDDSDSGGGGDQDSGTGDDDGDQPDDDSTPFSKDAALGMFTAAAASPAFRFEFTAVWNDVVAKAKRIRAEGHVRITHASPGIVIGEVRGDHDTYESGIQRPVGRRQTIQHWACGCPWASFHQDKAAASRYAGRPCSHVMALQFEAQSQGMFGRSLSVDAEPATWAPPSVVVKSMPPYDGAPHRGRWREEWRAPLAHLARQPGNPYVPPLQPGDLAQHIIHHHGLNADHVAQAMNVMGDDRRINDWARRWHDSEHQYRTSHAMEHQHETPIGTVGETRWPDVFEPEHGFRLDEYGGAPLRQDIPETSPFEPMPPHWSSLGAPSDRATYVLARSGADPDEIGALRLLAGLRATADQANAPWGSQNVSAHPPQKPYGATSPPNKDQDPGSYGPLAAPDPENWGGIQDDSAYQMPLTNSAALHQVLVPGAPRPVPGDVNWPDINGWQAEDQGTFGFTDHSNAAGPSTAMTPRDPNGIRMEESRYSTRWFQPSYGYDHHAGAVAQGTRNAAERNRDQLLVPFGDRNGNFPQIAVTDDYSFGNNRGHFRVSPQGDWSRYSPDTGYDRWHGAPQHHEMHAQSELNRLREAAPSEASHYGPDEATYHHHEGPIDPVFGALAAGTPFPVNDTVPQLDGALAELHDRPEPALPSTTGDDEIETTAAADGTIGGGDAGTGQGQGTPLDTAALGEFGASLQGLLRHHLAGTPMGDQARANWPQAQQPSPVGQEPGMGSTDDALGPDDPSIQTIGNQQWSGGGADSDEVAVPAGQPQGDMSDIVAAFQRSAASRSYAGGAASGHGDGDIAVAARRYLSKTADALPQAEADELIREGRGQRARNLDLLHLAGTHYEEEDEELNRKGVSLDDHDDDVMFA